MDLTKEYHNLLQKEEDEQTQSFLWDGNVVSVLEENSKEYYFQDELGSPIRIVNEDNKIIATYAYDEFGKVTNRNTDNKQPFTYVGYCDDYIANTYFAQAREYLPESGRFISEDWIKGSIRVPMRLNQYNYCYNNPINYIDKNGKKGYYFFSDNFEDGTRETEKDVDNDIAQLEEYFGFEIEKIYVENEEDFVMGWSNMNDENGIDVVIIYTHGSEGTLYFTNPQDRESRAPEQYLNYDELEGLEEKYKDKGVDMDKDIDYLVAIACNIGGTKNEVCMAEEILDAFPQISYVIAADRRVFHGGVNGQHTLRAQSYIKFYLEPINMINRINGKGFQLFSQDSESIFLGSQYGSVTELIAAGMAENKD